MAWVLFIFCLYPVGLAAFGAATMGGRFYAQLALAFMAFIIIASREITEKDLKWVIFFILGGSIVNATYSIASFIIFGPGDEIINPGADADGFYTWHQSLGTPALAISFLLFAWKKPERSDRVSQSHSSLCFI
jgi:glucan phosphoethanolaminetransferase (alkaline phosphatase superfamily)